MKHVPLSPVDRIFVGAEAYPVEFMFRYQQLPSDLVLKEALAKAIKAFPLVTSRMEETESGLVFRLTDLAPELTIDWDEAPLPELAKEELYRMVDPVTSLPEQPLVRLRLTRSGDAAWLAVSMSHALVDGFSFFYFLSSWAALCRGEAIVPPSHDRTYLRRLGADAPVSPAADDFFDSCGYLFGEPRRHRRDEVVWSSELIPAAAKGDGQRGAAVGISTNDRICAALLQQHHSSSPRRTFAMAYDFRGVVAGVPPNYFGNAIVSAQLAIERDRCRGMSLEALARAIRDRSSEIDSVGIERNLNYLSAVFAGKPLHAAERVHVTDPHSGLFVTNMSRLAGKRLDFGRGAPTRIELMSPAQGVYALVAHAAGIELQYCNDAALAATSRAVQPRVAEVLQEAFGS